MVGILVGLQYKIMKTKNCSKCKQEKKLTEFYFRKNSNTYEEICKECRSLECKLWREKNRKKISNRRKKYYKKFPWKKTLINIKQRCNNKNNTKYKNYGNRGIKCLITEEEIKQLWFRDKAYLMQKPSIDRIDNDGNYILENCQFIESKENSKKTTKIKPILQYDKLGNFIKEWRCINEAGIKLKINKSHICACAKKKLKTAGGFIWKYKKL